MSNYLQVPGLMSGLSTADIIQKMISVERMPLESLEKTKSLKQQKADALRDVNSRLTNLLNTVQKLNLRSTIDVKTVTTDIPSSSPQLLTASASSDAALGAFTVKVQELATATTVSSNTGSGLEAVGNAVVGNVALASAGFGTTPGTGTFSVNGAEVTIDATTVLSDGVDAIGANTIFARVRDATGGLAPDKQVTVSWGLDANGRQNKLVLTAGSAIQLGSGADTSNFLTAAGLAAVPPAASMTSARNLGGVNTGSLLNSSAANLSIALAPASGSFKINGVEITYDSAVDTLNSVISRINSSAANVIASYDSVNDHMTLTSRATGSGLIDLQDVAGNFLASMKLSEDYEAVGKNASYLLNGVQRYSTSNTVTDALPGITLNLKKQDPATTVTLTVGQDTSSAVSAVQDFVSQFNSAMSFIQSKTSYDTTLKKGGVLLGDTTVRSIQNTLKILVSGRGEGLSSVASSFSDIGITSGAVGTAVGQTDLLVLDSTKLTAKLQANPTAVADLFSALGENVALQAGGTGSILSISNTPDDHKSGTYSIVSDAFGTMTSTFTPSGGGSPVTKIGLITAGGVNTTMIPGVMITAKGVLVAGTDTITANFSPKGVGIKLADYLKSVTATDGILDSSQDSATKQIEGMNKSIQRMQDRLDAREKALYRRFAALEVVLARLQGQGSSLSAQIAQSRKQT